METTIKTSFNFAKEIQCNFITKNNPEHSYPGGLPEFITPYLQELQENTIIPDYTTLISITTIDNPDQDGIHILTFLKNDPELYRRLQTRLLLRNLSHRRRRLYSYIYRILYLERRRGWSYTWYKTFQRLQHIP